MIVVCPHCKVSINISNAEEVRMEAGVLQTICPMCHSPYAYPTTQKIIENLEVNH